MGKSSYSKDDCGQCTKCGEWCEVLEPCCGAGVAFEGSIVYADELED